METDKKKKNRVHYDAGDNRQGHEFGYNLICGGVAVGGISLLKAVLCSLGKG